MLYSAVGILEPISFPVLISKKPIPPFERDTTMTSPKPVLSRTSLRSIGRLTGGLWNICKYLDPDNFRLGRLMEMYFWDRSESDGINGSAE